MKIIKTASYKKAQWGLGRYENVVFMQGEEANKPLQILEDQGEKAAVKYLIQWHNPGEHETSETPGSGESDYVKKFGPYILSYNPRLGYIGMAYDTKAEKQDMGTWDGKEEPLLNPEADKTNMDFVQKNIDTNFKNRNIDPNRVR